MIHKGSAAPLPTANLTQPARRARPAFNPRSPIEVASGGGGSTNDPSGRDRPPATGTEPGTPA